MKKRVRSLTSVLLLFFTLALIALFAPMVSMADESTTKKEINEPKKKWAGVDETVVAKYARAYGREPADPLINTDQGDLLLFVFLVGGVLGGFTCGYYWRVLIEGGNSKTAVKTNTGGVKDCAVHTDTNKSI